MQLGLGLGLARSQGVGVWVPPFDVLSAPAFAAVGPAKLYRTYSGPLVRLRRASDSAQQDFSAGPNGWLDPVAVAAWAGGDAFVVTLYDQTGNTRHATQATAANQAKIATHCRSMISDGINDTAALSGSLGYAQNLAGLTAGLVTLSTSKVADNVFFMSSTAIPNTRFRVTRLATSGALAMQVRRLDADAAATLNTPTDMGDVWHHIIARMDYAAAVGKLRLDGVELTNTLGTTGTTSNTAAPSLMALESAGSASYLVGESAAKVWFQTALSDADAALLDTGLTQIMTGVLTVWGS